MALFFRDLERTVSVTLPTTKQLFYHESIHRKKVAFHHYPAFHVSYADFVVPLVKGMQEQQKQIEAQQQRIAELEKMLKEIKEKIR